jgi:hypothetical protein
MQNTGKRLPGPSSEVTCENPASFIEAQTTSSAYCRCMSNYSPMPAFFIVELFPLKTVIKRLDLCGISRISIWIFLHRRRRRFYAAPPLGGESKRTFFAFFKPGCREIRLPLLWVSNAWIPGRI